jgi:energy-coupling factor transporter ATP-binding protein EcfA2
MRNETRAKAKLRSESSRESLGDRPTDNDLLDYQDLARELATRIASLQTDDTPLCIGVYGPWGSGKTSFLMMVEKSLGDIDRSITPIHFNAWKYSRAENLWAALLQSILDHAAVSGGFFRRISVKLRIWWNTLDIRGGVLASAAAAGPVLLRLALAVTAIVVAFAWEPKSWPTLIGSSETTKLGARILLGLLGFAAAKPGDFVKLLDTRLGLDLERFRKKWSFKDQVAFLDVFSDEFNRIVALVAQSKPLLVVIDDLDRCLPQDVVSVLEAVKQFLDVPGCVFLIALDNDIVERAVAVKYKDMVQEANKNRMSLGSSYVEKIVHLPISLPRLSYNQIEEYVAKIAISDESRECSSLIARSLAPNPRKAKRILRVLEFALQHVGSRLQNQALVPILLAKLVILQYEFGTVFDEVVDRPDLLRALESVAMNETSVEVDPVLIERASEHVATYPVISELFRTSEHEIGMFKDVDLKSYLFYLPASQTTVPKSLIRTDSEEIPLRHYLSRFTSAQGDVTLGGFLPDGLRSYSLDDVFIPPLLSRVLPLDESEGSLVPMNKVLQGPVRLLIVGEPGSGKSTLLKKISVILAETWLSRNSTALQRALGAKELQIPVLFRAGDRRAKSDADIPPLKAVISQEIEKYSEHISDHELEQLLSTGRITLLLDGLDELPRRTRSSLAEQIVSFSATYPSCRCIVATRPLSGYSQSSLSRFETYVLAPLDEITVSELLHKWVRAAGLTQSLAASVDQIMRSAYLPFQGTPLAVVLLISVVISRGSLPTSRTQLLHAAVSIVLERWESAARTDRQIAHECVTDILPALALYMVTSGTAYVSVADVKEVLPPVFTVSADEVLQLLSAQLGVLKEIQPGEFRFVHRELQHYFAGVALTEERNLVEFIRGRSNALEVPDSREPIIHAYVLSSRRTGDAALDELLKFNSGESIELAAELATMVPTSPERKVRIIEHLRDLLASRAPSERASALKLLERLGPS